MYAFVPWNAILNFIHNLLLSNSNFIIMFMLIISSIFYFIILLDYAIFIIRFFRYVKQLHIILIISNKYIVQWIKNDISNSFHFCVIATTTYVNAKFSICNPYVILYTMLFCIYFY